MPNPTLLDNHQEELASTLQSMRYLKSATVEYVHESSYVGQTPLTYIRDLLNVLEALDMSDIQPFPPFEPSRFAKIVDETLGLI